MMLKVSAPGKIILSGEHSVVYGYPALVAAVDRRLSLELKKNSKGLLIKPSQIRSFARSVLEKTYSTIKVKPKYNYSANIVSDIPIGCGMGSSAAAATTIAAAVLRHEGKPRSLRKINEIAYAVEKKQHQNPSGVDNTISTYGGFLWYRKESEKLKIYKKIDKGKKLRGLYILNTGKPKEGTGEMVERVHAYYKQRPREVEGIFVEIEKIARSLLKLLTGEANLNLGELLQENERLLEKLGVVSRSTIRLIREVEKTGGAAKISGAGGVVRASGILLVNHQKPAILENFAKARKLEFSKVKFGEGGLRFEKSS